MSTNDYILSQDSVIVSKCINCNKCCLKGGTIPLNPIDLINIKLKTNKSIREVLKEYCAYAVITENYFPILTFKKLKTCKFLDNDRCSLEENRPDYCKTYPLIRTTDTKGNTIFYLNDKICNESSIKGIASVKNIIGNPTDEYRSCIEDWYKAIETLSINTTGRLKDMMDKLDEETKEVVDIIILHIIYRSLESVQTEDYKIIKYEMNKRYEKVAELLLQLESYIIKILDEKENNKTSTKCIELQANLKKISLPTYMMDQLKETYISNNI